MTELFTGPVSDEFIRPLSPSKLGDVKFGCGLYFKFKRIDKIDDGPSQPRDEGNILHLFQAHYLRHCQKEKLFSDLSAVEGLLGKAIRDFEADDGKLNGIDYDELLGLALQIAELEPVELSKLKGIELKAAFDQNGKPIEWWEAYRRKVGTWGITDKLLYDEEHKLATIKDLKTGFGRVVDPDQLIMYAYAASRLLPEAEFFELIFQYIRPRPWSQSFPGDGLYYSRDEVEQLMRELEEEKLPRYLKVIEGFKPNPGPRCEKCPFATICDYRASEPGEVENVAQVEQAIRDAIHERAKAEQRLKPVRKWVKLQAAAVARQEYDADLEDLPAEQQAKAYEKVLLTIDGKVIGYVGKPSDSWHKAGLFELLRAMDVYPVEFFNVDKRKLGKLFNNNPEIKEAAEVFKSTEVKVRWEGT